MKKSILIISVILALSANLFAQVSVDPTDDFYKYAQNWELKGYIDPLPLLRPYPASTIKAILEKVIDCHNKHDAEIALNEYERIFSKKYHLYADGGIDLKHQDNWQDGEEDSDTKNLRGEGGICGELILHPLVDIGYDLAFFVESAEFDDIAPYYTNKGPDSIFDPSSIGPFDMFLDWNMNTTVGTQTIYATAGLSKVGYGPFIGDGLTLNDTGFHSANFMTSYNGKRVSYASVYEIIGATTNNPDVYDDHGDGKYLAFHTIKFRLNKNIDISYYENIIFGPRPNIAYLFPIPYMPVQNIGGASDNLQMGLLFEIKPLPGLCWATDIFVDDFSVNEVVKLNFDSKIRLAGQTGLVFSPMNSPCNRMTLNYQMVLPYVYSHWEYAEENHAYIYGKSHNYQNYTNAGVNIGSVLDPNSDKVSFTASFSPAKWLKINLNTNYIRHANSAEAFNSEDAGTYVLAKSGQYATDGSAYMHQMFSNDEEDENSGIHVDQAWDCLGFMTSEHKMGIIQAGLNSEIMLPKTKKGAFTIKLGYTFEYVKNAGVNKNIYKGGNLKWEANKDGTYTDANGTNYASWKELVKSDYVQNEVRNQKEAWVSALTDRVNHYISIGGRWQY